MCERETASRHGDRQADSRKDDFHSHCVRERRTIGGSRSQGKKGLDIVLSGLGGGLRTTLKTVYLEYKVLTVSPPNKHNHILFHVQNMC